MEDIARVILCVQILLRLLVLFLQCRILVSQLLQLHRPLQELVIHVAQYLIRRDLTRPRVLARRNCVTLKFVHILPRILRREMARFNLRVEIRALPLRPRPKILRLLQLQLQHRRANLEELIVRERLLRER